MMNNIPRILFAHLKKNDILGEMNSVCCFSGFHFYWQNFSNPGRRFGQGLYQRLFRIDPQRRRKSELSGAIYSFFIRDAVSTSAGSRARGLCTFSAEKSKYIFRKYSC
jgi:hypothetical protein